MEALHDPTPRLRRRRLNAESATALLAEWEASGLSAAEFAAEQGISAQTLHRWRHQLARQERGEPVLCRVTTPASATCGPVVESRAGVRVLMPAAFTDDQLRSVVRVLAAC